MQKTNKQVVTELIDSLIERCEKCQDEEIRTKELVFLRYLKADNLDGFIIAMSVITTMCHLKPTILLEIVNQIEYVRTHYGELK